MAINVSVESWTKFWIRASPIELWLKNCTSNASRRFRSIFLQCRRVFLRIKRESSDKDPDLNKRKKQIKKVKLHKLDASDQMLWNSTPAYKKRDLLLSGDCHSVERSLFGAPNDTPWTVETRYSLVGTQQKKTFQLDLDGSKGRYRDRTRSRWIFSAIFLPGSGGDLPEYEAFICLERTVITKR